MKKVGVIIACAVQMALVGCSALPIKASIEEGHYRLEGMQKETFDYTEFLSAGCFVQRPLVRAAGGVTTRQAGEDSFWVEANVKPPGMRGARYAYVKLTGNFEEQKRYFLNRSREGDQISIWAQEVGSETIVSNVAKATYRPEAVDEIKKRQLLCGDEHSPKTEIRRTVNAD